VVSFTALTAIMNEWKSGNTYSVRVGHILNGGGLNGVNRLYSGTVFTDGAADWLYGEAGQDWFLASSEDQLPDRNPFVETRTLI